MCTSHELVTVALIVLRFEKIIHSICISSHGPCFPVDLFLKGTMPCHRGHDLLWSSPIHRQFDVSPDPKAIQCRRRYRRIPPLPRDHGISTEIAAGTLDCASVVGSDVGATCKVGRCGRVRPQIPQQNPCGGYQTAHVGRWRGVSHLRSGARRKVRVQPQTKSAPSLPPSTVLHTVLHATSQC